MTVAFGAAGAIAYGSTSVAPAYPSGITAGQLLVLVIGIKPPASGQVTTPSGWTDDDLAYAQGSTGSNGADTGPTKIVAYTKVATGTESGTLSVAIASGNSCWGIILRLAGDGDTWGIDFGSVIDSSGNSSFGGTTINPDTSAAKTVAVTAGDLVIAAAVTPTDLTANAFGSQTLSTPGVTYGTVTEIAEPNSSTGNDVHGDLWYAIASAGTATGVTTIGATISGTATNQYGPSLVIRVRSTTSGGSGYVLGDLLFEDVFEGTAGTPPNGLLWNPDVYGATENDEIEYYTDSTSNLALDGLGHLAITVREEDTTEGATTWHYTSARLTTLNRFTQQYGRFEASIKLPVGRGLWPAFWMLGANIDDVGWPDCGEIDIMENLAQDTEVIYQSLHGPGPWDPQTSLDTTGTDLSAAFHTYAIDWTPDGITWYLDGTQIWTRAPADAPGAGWVFDHPFFLLLNVAVGGWAGAVSGVSFPQTMLVDYVRVYELTDGSVTSIAVDPASLTLAGQTTSPTGSGAAASQSADTAGLTLTASAPIAGGSGAAVEPVGPATLTTAGQVPQAAGAAVVAAVADPGVLQLAGDGTAEASGAGSVTADPAALAVTGLTPVIDSGATAVPVEPAILDLASQVLVVAGSGAAQPLAGPADLLLSGGAVTADAATVIPVEPAVLSLQALAPAPDGTGVATAGVIAADLTLTGISCTLDAAILIVIEPATLVLAAAAEPVISGAGATATLVEPGAVLLDSPDLGMAGVAAAVIVQAALLALLAQDVDLTGTGPRPLPDHGDLTITVPVHRLALTSPVHELVLSAPVAALEVT